jgi:hypothetical protein
MSVAVTTALLADWVTLTNAPVPAPLSALV